MTLKTQMITDLTAIYNADEFAELVLYTPIGGVQTTITAIVDREYSHQEDFIRGPDTAIALISVQKSEVANPQYGDIFTFDSQVWELDPERGVVYEDDDEFEIMVWRRD